MTFMTYAPYITLVGFTVLAVVVITVWVCARKDTKKRARGQTTAQDQYTYFLGKNTIARESFKI